MLKTIKSFLNIGLWTGLTILFGVITIKKLSILAGPVGVAYFSIFRQLQQTFVTLATFTGDTALIQGIASREGRRSIGYAMAIGKAIAAISVILGLLCFFSFYIFEATWYEKLKIQDSTTLYLLLISSILASLVLYFNSVLNGNGHITITAKLQTASACCGAIYIYTSISRISDMAIAGILVAISLIGSVLAGYYAFKLNYISLPILTRLTITDKADLNYFFKISWITTLIGFSGAGTMLLVRFMLIHAYGLEDVGLFDGAWIVSLAYLALLLNTFPGYILPKLSACKDTFSFHAEIGQLMHSSLIVSTAMIVTFVYLKPIAFSVLYTSAFSGSREIFRWLLIGDYFKVIIWALTIPMLSRSYMKPMLFISLGANILFLFGIYICIALGGKIEEVGFVYLVVQVLSAVSAFLYWSKFHRLSLRKDIFYTGLGGLFLIAICSILTWNDSILKISSGVIISILLTSYLFFVLRSKLRKYLIEKLTQAI